VQLSDRTKLLDENASEEVEFEIGEIELKSNPMSPQLSNSFENKNAIANANERKIAVRVTAGEFAWDTSPILSGINLEINSGELIIVVGHVGAGKSSLLTTLISEMRTVLKYLLK
jgi:ABC-type transport system involved in cytochrome bd biosynthesis fused ATPase/permease subunit